MKTILSGKIFKWAGVIFFTSLFFIGSLQAWQLAIAKVTQSNQWQVTTLVYHRFGDARYPSTNTTKSSFEEQLRWLKQNDYISVMASEVAMLTDKDEKKYVCITVDDGYKSFKENGMPLLKKYGMKATVFVNTQSVGWGDYLTWDDLKELQKEGIEIGSHSHSHDYFLNKNKEERLIYFESDLGLSEKLFKKYLGAKPRTYAYPYGEFDQEMKALIKHKGYKLAFAQNSGVWNETSDFFAIPRFPMSGSIDIDSFTSKMLMKPLRMVVKQNIPLVINSKQQAILDLSFNKHIYITRFNCFVNGSSFNNVQFKDDSIHINVKAPLKRRRNLITFTTKNKDNDWCWTSYLIVASDLKE
nr:polysaccharide deacetylase family protein [uncultured Carboxylicivirga sp.]